MGARLHEGPTATSGGRRFRIRTKLAAALSLPLAGLLLVTVAEVRATWAEAGAVRREAALAEASFGPASITNAVQAERAFAGVFMVGQEANFSLQVSSNAEARAQTDEVVERFTADLDEAGGRLRAAYAPALAALDGLGDARAAVDGTDESRRTLANGDAATGVFDRYSAIVDALADGQAEVTSSITDADLRNGAELLELANRQADLVARLVRNMLMPAVTGDTTLNQRDEVAPVAIDLAELDANAAAIRAHAGGPYAPMVERLLATDHVRDFPDFVRDAVATGRIDVAAAGPTATGTDPDRFGYVVFRDAVADRLATEAAQARADAETQLRTFAALAAVVTAVAVGTTVAAVRSITGPLRTLTDQARAMAGHHLPDAVRHVLSTPLGDDIVVPTLDPVRVASRDEVADVAGALDDVQATALDLALEQGVLRRNLADAFVSLGRRNQNLVSRQLDFITSLEAREADPDTLDALFRLDHLATRVRRNAESLLVLAGLEAARKWTAPQRLIDVVRSAIGEVDDYRRVRAVDLAPATVRGTVAADVAHLLAELVENGLRASAPAGGVEVHGRSHPGGGYLLAVMDDGVGMPPADIALANRRLAGEESFTVAPSRYLGHYVVGHLAARHGVRASVVPSHGGGITALVELPTTLMADEPTRPPSASSPTPPSSWSSSAAAVPQVR